MFIFLSLSLFLVNPVKVFANDTDKPAAITINIYDTPRAVVALDKAYLIYEIYLTSYMTTPITLTSLETLAATQPLLKPEDFAKSIQTVNPNDKVNPFIFQPGESKIIYMWFPFDELSKVPSQLKHVFRFTTESDGENYKLFYPVQEVNKTPPLIVGPPLRGSNWVAGNGLSNGSAHRRAVNYFNGRPYFAERYAIDFVQMDAEGSTFTGDENKNSSYYAYNQDLLAVAKGKVVLVKDGIPENIPHSGKLAEPLTLNNIGGNFIILDLGNGKFASYAHLIPGSLKVKVGDFVNPGQVMAKLGNSGNSSEPHLHFHIGDKPSMLVTNGIPYGFDQFKLKATQRVDNQVQFLKTPALNYLNQLPLEDSVIDFDGNLK